MESGNGILCWTGRVVEADIDLVVNQTGSIVQEGVVDSDPEAIASFVRSRAPGTVRIGIETGPTTTLLWTELKRLGLPVICIDAAPC
jgi:transposase